MKKILLTTAAVAAISTSAFASDMMENQFFLGGAVDGVMISKFKTGAYKVKSKYGFGLDISAGYYVMDDVRVELSYNRPFINKMTGSASDDTPVTIASTAATVSNSNRSIKHKPSIHALFAKVSGDVVDLGMGKIFLTGGIGLSQVKNSITTSDTRLTVVAPVAPATANTLATTTPSTTIKHSAKNNFAWTVGAGAAFDVTDGVHLDVAYSYRAYGKAKSAKTSTLKANSFSSHNLSAGLRFDI